MRIALLITNTDDSAFATRWPLDDEKFTTLLGEARPDWQTEAFWVCKGVFPTDLAAFDGVLISGSPASLNDDLPWIAPLLDLIRESVDSGPPLFGACFGHQAIARALGCGIVRNPDGWAHGLIEMTREAHLPWSGPSERIALYGSHIEQVATPPPGAVVTFSSPGCPIAGFAIGHHVATVQHHPEMTPAFVAALVEEYAAYTGPEVTAAARASLRGTADRAEFAEEIASFFEVARAEGG